MCLSVSVSSPNSQHGGTVHFTDYSPSSLPDRAKELRINSRLGTIVELRGVESGPKNCWF